MALMYLGLLFYFEQIRRCWGGIAAGWNWAVDVVKDAKGGGGVLLIVNFDCFMAGASLSVLVTNVNTPSAHTIMSNCRKKGHAACHITYSQGWEMAMSWLATWIFIQIDRQQDPPH
ncbi:hypothetical protein HAX54_038420 [Datura stramonium]|uniref:Uncharacterized protein n=1 Tax=Datura stramonium TaxID=4076 RepID=A0ABS8VN05_DATST|nr:hypothetical protein [Datura stramonium]